MNTASKVVGIIALILMILGLIPFLGWINWLVNHSINHWTYCRNFWQEQWRNDTKRNCPYCFRTTFNSRWWYSLIKTGVASQPLFLILKI